jgi:hypothetical protein
MSEPAWLTRMRDPWWFVLFWMMLAGWAYYVYEDVRSALKKRDQAQEEKRDLWRIFGQTFLGLVVGTAVAFLAYFLSL